MQAIGETVRPTRGEAITKALGFVAVVGATIFVIWQLRPGLIFGPNMDVGGDNAGHIVTPYFLIHDLLPQGRITGWDPQWFEGFPLYVFYFPLPALFVAAFSVVFPYAVAFKLVTVLGPVTLPVSAWAFGSLAGFRKPIPALMAMATLPFLFNTSYTIEGGNVTSTLAGEFSFALALTTGLLFLGVFAYALRTGRLRWLAAALYGVTLLCHVVPALGYAAIAILLALSHWNRNTWRVLVPVGVVGALLAAFWLVPFGADLSYSSSMGYTRVTGVWSNIFPHGYIWMIVPAGLGILVADHPSRPDADRAQRRGRSHRLPVSSGYRPVSSTTAGGCPSTSCSRRSSPPTASGSCSAWEASGCSTTSGRHRSRSCSAASPP